MSRVVRIGEETWARAEARVGTHGKPDDKIRRLLDMAGAPQAWEPDETTAPNRHNIPTGERK